MRTPTRPQRAAVLLAACAILVLAAAPAVARTGGNSVSISVTDPRDEVVRRIGSGLLLRLRKERSATQEHFGWDVEVIRLPERSSSRNLVYHNDGGHGPDESMVYAWHVTDGYYPNHRELAVTGYPIVVTIDLADPKAVGHESDAAFESGTLTVSWARTRKP